MGQKPAVKMVTPAPDAHVAVFLADRPLCARRACDHQGLDLDVKDRRPPSSSQKPKSIQGFKPAFTSLASEGDGSVAERCPTTTPRISIMKHVGIDVSATELHAAANDAKRAQGTFANTPEGRKKLIRWIARDAAEVHVCIEPTGVYSLDLAFELHDTPGVEVMVANPRAVHAFASASMQRGKSDPLDAALLLRFAQAMPFVPWTAPPKEALALRQVTRRIDAVVREATRLKNQLHAAESTSTTPEVIVDDLRMALEATELRAERLRVAAARMIDATPDLDRRFQQLRSVKGVGEKSAIQLLGELATMSDQMDTKQWVAHAGLDPTERTSGTSVRSRPRISKRGNRYLRSALFMPAMAAVRFVPTLKAFHARLVQRGKTPLQAVVAIMRKLLHALHAMFRTGQSFDATKLCAA